jgi:hypothetical protein
VRRPPTLLAPTRCLISAPTSARRRSSVPVKQLVEQRHNVLKQRDRAEQQQRALQFKVTSVAVTEG